MSFSSQWLDGVKTCSGRLWISLMCWADNNVMEIHMISLFVFGVVGYFEQYGNTDGSVAHGLGQILVGLQIVGRSWLISIIPHRVFIVDL